MSPIPTQILVVGGPTASRDCLERMLQTSGVCSMATTDVAYASSLLGVARFDWAILDPREVQGDLTTLAEQASSNGTRIAVVDVDDAEAEKLRAERRFQLPWPSLPDLLRGLTPRTDVTAEPDADAKGIHLLRERCKELERAVAENQETLEIAQESFNQEISRMMNIISNIMDGILFTDADGSITLMNPVAEELLGLRAFMTVGRSLWELESEAGDLLTAILTDCARADDWREKSRVIEVHQPDQDLLYIRLRVSRVLNYRAEFAGMLVQMQDVTAEHKTDQLKNQYLSIVAHELRTPLTGIKTFSTMMAKGTLGELNERQSRVVDSIREQSLRLEHQIDKLINLGHIESNEYGQDVEIFDISELIRLAVVPFVQPARDSGIDIELHGADEERVVEGDRAELRRAVQALIENAVKFTPEGGHILVELNDASEEEIQVVVSDDGVGIDPRYHRRIFEKFFQVEDPLTRHHGGSGLGLFFVKGIVDAHNSTVQVDSEIGNGAKFSFTLSRRSPQDSEHVLAGSTAAEQDN